MTATKIQPGDDLHLTSLMAPHSLNFVTGADRAALLAYGRDVFAAARASQCLAQIEEPAQPVAEICSASHDDAQFGERAIKPLCDISGFEYGTPLYAGAAPAAVARWGREDRAAWFALAMGAAASLEDAANCLRDKDAQKAAMGAATHVRESCNRLWWAAPALEAPAAPCIIDIGEGGQLHRATPDSQNWALHQGHAHIRYLNKFERNFVNSAIRAALAAAPQAPAAPSIPQWIDDPHDIEQGQMLNPAWVKAQAQAVPAAPLESGPAGSGGWESHARQMERERDHWRDRARVMSEHKEGIVWYWQGDGEDHPESWVNTLPVVIRADELRALMGPATPAAPAVDADPMAEFLRDTGPAIVWPKARDVGRIGDMSPSAHLRIGLDSDNDVYASIWDERGGATIEFCTPGQGGGKSSRTRMALLAVMVAMEADNAADPGRDWWAERNGAAQAAAKGAHDE